MKQKLSEEKLQELWDKLPTIRGLSPVTQALHNMCGQCQYCGGVYQVYQRSVGTKKFCPFCRTKLIEDDEKSIEEILQELCNPEINFEVEFKWYGWPDGYGYARVIMRPHNGNSVCINRSKDENIKVIRKAYKLFKDTNYLTEFKDDDKKIN